MSARPDANFIWSTANRPRGPYNPKEYCDVVLPMTILPGSTACFVSRHEPTSFA